METDDQVEGAPKPKEKRQNFDVRNNFKQILDQNQMTPWAFARDSGLSEATSYRCYKDREYWPTAGVIQAWLNVFPQLTFDDFFRRVKAKRKTRRH